MSFDYYFERFEEIMMKISKKLGDLWFGKEEIKW